MSTRSYIAIEGADESLRAIYCHFDGYPEGVGATLEQHYGDRAKVEALLALGNISTLGAEIGEKHKFDMREEGVTTAYERDRGETGQEAVTFVDDAAFCVYLSESWVEWAYKFTPNGGWMIRRVCGSDWFNGWLPLALVLRDGYPDE